MWQQQRGYLKIVQVGKPILKDVFSGCGIKNLEGVESPSV
jgi:hypothetical protein